MTDTVTDTVTETAPTATEAAPVESTQATPSSSDSKMVEIFNQLAGKTEANAETPKADDPAAPVQGKTQKSEGNADPEKLRVAREAMKRFGYTDEDIQDLPANRVLDLGQKAKAQLDAKQKEYDEKQRLSKLLAEIEKERRAPAQTVTDPQKPAIVQPAADSTDPIEAEIAALTGEYGDALGKSLRKIVDAVRPKGDLASELRKEMDTKLRQLSAAYEDIALDQARNTLSKEFPQLKDSETNAKVRNKIAQLANLPNYYDEAGRPMVAELYRDAASIVLSKQTLAERQTQSAKRLTEQLDGQPDSANSMGDTPTKSLTPEDVMKLALKKLQGGDDPREVNKSLGSVLSKVG